MPDFTFKNAFFRIFWKILAKTGPQTLYSCGFPEARGGNGGRPFQGIDTIFPQILLLYPSYVEMKVAPFRALTHKWLRFIEMILVSGNEGRPIQGIDTATTSSG